ncbi:MAG: hypothetical protein U0Q22_13405 [Acidimicrobiales bacterium]
MEIIRHDDGTLSVPVPPDRHATEEAAAAGAAAPETMITLHPGEGGYDEALAEWDLQQHGGEAAVSTASGREEAMHVVHEVAVDPSLDVADAIEELDDPDASAEALRHVLVGGVHSVEDFAAEVADHEGGEPLPAHRVTKIIGEVLAEIDS